MSLLPNIAGIILCGGKSSRMGYPKALLPFGDEMLLQRVARILASVARPVVVVSAAGQTLPKLAAEVIFATDDRPERGPLEGLRAGLAALPADIGAAYVTSCDVPLLSPEFIARMIAELGDQAIAVPVEEQGGKQFHHPLAAVYRRALLPVVESLLAADQLRPVFLFDSVDTHRVPVESLRAADPDLHSLRNVNRPDDYRAAAEIAAVEIPSEIWDQLHT